MIDKRFKGITYSQMCVWLPDTCEPVGGAMNTFENNLIQFM